MCRLTTPPTPVALGVNCTEMPLYVTLVNCTVAENSVMPNGPSSFAIWTGPCASKSDSMSVPASSAAAAPSITS